MWWNGRHNGLKILSQIKVSA